MANAKQAVVVGLEGGTVNVAAENLEAAMAVRGFSVLRYFDKPGRREEMQGAPVFKNLAGPMYGGPGIVRYETVQAYAELSR